MSKFENAFDVTHFCDQLISEAREIKGTWKKSSLDSIQIAFSRCGISLARIITAKLDGILFDPLSSTEIKLKMAQLFSIIGSYKIPNFSAAFSERAKKLEEFCSSLDDGSASIVTKDLLIRSLD